MKKSHTVCLSGLTLAAGAICAPAAVHAQSSVILYGIVDAGITYVNAPTIGAEVHLPFGGTKATGNGHREGGIGAIDFYTEWKSVYVDYSDTLQRAQIDRPE